MKRTYRVKIIVNNCDTIFKEGLDPGVLGQQDAVYDLSVEDFEKPIFIKELMDRRAELLTQLIKTEVVRM